MLGDPTPGLLKLQLDVAVEALADDRPREVGWFAPAGSPVGLARCDCLDMPRVLAEERRHRFLGTNVLVVCREHLVQLALPIG
jgi:hypothetical protein